MHRVTRVNLSGKVERIAANETQRSRAVISQRATSKLECV